MWSNLIILNTLCICKVAEHEVIIKREAPNCSTSADVLLFVLAAHIREYSVDLVPCNQGSALKLTSDTGYIRNIQAVTL